MAQSWGKDAIITVDGTGIDRTKDITPTNQANDLSASARSMPTKIHHQGAKDVGVSFQRLMQDTNPTDQALLITKFDSGDEVTVVVRRKTGGIGFTFKGVVIQCQESFPEEGAAFFDVVIMISDETSFARVAAS